MNENYLINENMNKRKKVFIIYIFIFKGFFLGLWKNRNFFRGLVRGGFIYLYRLFFLCLFR